MGREARRTLRDLVARRRPVPRVERLRAGRHPQAGPLRAEQPHASDRVVQVQAGLRRIEEQKKPEERSTRKEEEERKRNDEESKTARSERSRN